MCIPHTFSSPGLGTSFKFGSCNLCRRCRACLSFRPLVWGLLLNDETGGGGWVRPTPRFRPLVWGLLLNSYSGVFNPIPQMFSSPGLGTSFKLGSFVGNRERVIKLFSSPGLGTSFKWEKGGQKWTLWAVFVPWSGDFF